MGLNTCELEPVSISLSNAPGIVSQNRIRLSTIPAVPVVELRRSVWWLSSILSGSGKAREQRSGHRQVEVCPESQ